MTKNIAILTSGGDAPGMNAAIRAIVLAGHRYQYKIFGFYHGYNGLINNELKPLAISDVEGVIHRGGTLLKSARCKEMRSKTGVSQAVNVLLKNKIDALIVIGGDGSFNGLLAIHEQWQGQVIGIPGTIDNDIDGTDFTIGFSTAVDTALSAIDKIRDTADAFERVFLVELMGRQSGQITFNVGVSCAAEKVLSFENFNIQQEQETLEQISTQIQTAKQAKHSSFLIVIAENLWPNGSEALAKKLTSMTGIDCTLCTLGYIQRGGSPVAKDRILATKMGVSAIQAISQGKSNIMVGEQNNAICLIPLTQAVEHNKTVSPLLIDAQENILALSKQTDAY
ncbi:MULTISPECIES: ATP-dependent 6-phosphofructokinase [Thalassotalea]|uniref:6-phosphofructokinase n=1 Tax=Thalassotalea castellviae TaxID=3075612 RepID=A0ABU2ZWP2_9GAMM|nr:ATP-dependent 6-phosphofructokinase [Thalassotalea sp. W431]MDT0602085.1 ATP-dependent 6-phosphofructokinase [Thalassotalea sp. W431]